MVDALKARAGVNLHVGYLVTHYPALSHVFIEREVREVRAAGVAVSTFAIRPTSPNDLLGEANQEAARTTICLFDLSKAVWFRSALRNLIRNPRALFAALGASLSMARTARDVVWQSFYFLEAVVLFEQARKQGVNHLHVHHANNVAEVARLACILSSQEAVPWKWSLAMHGSAEFWNVERFRLREKVEAASMVACISDFTRSQLMALVPRKHWEKLHIVHMGVDMGAYPALADTRSARPADPTRVLFVGRLLEAKGLSLLLEAVGDLVRQGFAFELRVVGDGPYREPLRELIRARRLDDVVVLRGPVGQDKILEEYEWADVFCLPSFIEGIPVVLMEALATELPVVTTQITGISELVEDGRVGGLLIRPGRTDLLSDALRRLSVDKDWAIALGRAGRVRVSKEFNSAVEARKLALLLEAAGKTRGKVASR